MFALKGCLQYDQQLVSANTTFIRLSTRMKGKYTFFTIKNKNEVYFLFTLIDSLMMTVLADYMMNKTVVYRLRILSS